MSEWTTVVSKKNNKQSKNKIKIIVQPTSYKSSSTIKPRFDFQLQNTQQIKSISNNKLPDLKKKKKMKGNQNQGLYLVIQYQHHFQKTRKNMVFYL